MRNLRVSVQKHYLSIPYRTHDIYKQNLEATG